MTRFRPLTVSAVARPLKGTAHGGRHPEQRREMPFLGLGVFQIPEPETEATVRSDATGQFVLGPRRPGPRPHGDRAGNHVQLRVQHRHPSVWRHRTPASAQRSTPSRPRRPPPGSSATRRGPGSPAAPPRGRSTATASRSGPRRPSPRRRGARGPAHPRSPARGRPSDGRAASVLLPHRPVVGAVTGAGALGLVEGRGSRAVDGRKGRRLSKSVAKAVAGSGWLR